MKKHAVSSLRKILLLGTITTTVSLSAQAATLDDVVASINALRAYIESAVQSTMKTVNDLIYEDNPSMPATVTGNVGANNARPAISKNSEANTLNAIKTSLTNKENKEVTRIATLPASDTYTNQTVSFNIFGNQTTTNFAEGDKNFSLDTLLGTTNFSPSTQQQAENFIQIASNLYNPILPDITLKGLSDSQVTELQKSPDFQKYEAALRAYIAAQSVGISNLNQMLAVRITQKDLGSNTGLTDSNGNKITDASIMQVEEYLAKRRATNKDWYDQMAAASPATVSRETLFVLAELRQQLFELQKQNERLLATMSMMQLQTGQLNRSLLEQTAAPVKAQIDKYKGKKAEEETPNVEIPNQ